MFSKELGPTTLSTFRTLLSYYFKNLIIFDCKDILKIVKILIFDLSLEVEKGVKNPIFLPFFVKR